MTDTKIVPTVVGIDLGSLTSRCAELNVARRMPTIVRSKLSNESTPSVTFFPPTGEGERAFGEAVATKDIMNPDNTISNLKEWLMQHPTEGRTFPSIVTKDEDIEVTVAQALGFTLRQILDNAPAYRRYLSAEGTQDDCAGIVLSVPTACANNADVHTAVHQAVALCCSKAELPIPVSLVAESDAMVAYFHHLRYDSHEEGGATTVIVDIGHKTTSLVCVKVVKGTVTVKATASIDIGSGSIDEGLCDLVFDDILTKQKRDIKSHAKSYKKVLRECKKAKEILSSVDTSMVQLEGLAEDTDVSSQVTRTQLVACGQKLAAGIRSALETHIIPTIVDEVAAESIRLECVGGGWRSPFLQEQLKTALKANRVGVTLDSNLCIAEGCAILGAVKLYRLASEEQKGGFDAVHDVTMDLNAEAEIANAKAAAAASNVPQAWRDMEVSMAAADAKYLAFHSAIDKLQSLVYSTQALLGRAGNVKDETYRALSALLDEIDDLAATEGTTTETLLATHDAMEAKVNAIPEVRAQMDKEEADAKRKEEEFIRLSKLQDEDKELKSDPQRLRVAQQRREQGTTLFKQECWEESQTRFVQALSILGQIYDTDNEENKTKKNEISLSCHLNIASCCVKLGRWRIAISNCSNALDISPNNAKALFRRGQAYSAQGEYTEALSDLNKAKELTNGDATILAEIEHVEKKIAHDKAKEKKMYGKMFA